MSNDRLYLHCCHCGDVTCIAKFYPGQAFTLWGDDPARASTLSGWICRHMEHNPKFFDLDLGLDSGFEILTEDQLEAEQKADELDAGRSDVDAREPISDGSSTSVAPGSDAVLPDVRSGVSNAPAPSKSDRLAVAKQALSDAEILARIRAQAAARQKRHRERKRRQS